MSTSSTHDAAAHRPSNWNVPNALTLLRIVLVPVFVVLLLRHGGSDVADRWWAFGVFAVAMITDRIDGDLARRYGLVTDFGKIADPIADKLLMGSALVLLSAMDGLSWWITGIILVREIGVTLMRFWVIRWGVIAASAGGKLKTVSQALGTFLLLLPWAMQWAWLWWIGVVVLVVAAALTLWSAIDYVRQATALYRQHKAQA